MTTAGPPPSLVPAAVRRPVLAAIAAAALVFTVLAVRFAGTSEAGGVDRRVDAVVDPVGDAHWSLVRLGERLGSPPSVVALAFLMAGLCLAAGRYRPAVLAVVGPGVTGVCTTLLKPALGRTIGDGFAYPSGHTGGATSLGLVAALLLLTFARRRLPRGLWLAGLAAGGLVLGAATGTAMIAANVHYPTDTIGGFCTAVVVVLGIALLLDLLAPVWARWTDRRLPS
jgi:membrane-associated phospholipid phosphatase